MDSHPDDSIQYISHTYAVWSFVTESDDPNNTPSPLATKNHGRENRKFGVEQLNRFLALFEEAQFIPNNVSNFVITIMISDEISGRVYVGDKSQIMTGIGKWAFVWHPEEKYSYARRFCYC